MLWLSFQDFRKSKSSQRGTRGSYAAFELWLFFEDFKRLLEGLLEGLFEGLLVGLLEGLMEGHFVVLF